MKYTYCERVIWVAMSPAICRYLATQYPAWDIGALKKKAKRCYRQMVARTPDIGSFRQNSHRMNLTGGMVWLSFYKSTPEEMKDACFAGMIRTAMTAPLVKASYQMSKNRMFTPRGFLRRAERLMRNNAASNSPFNWVAEVNPGRDAQEHTVAFRRCGLCALGKQEGLHRLIPYMCEADYLTFPMMGGRLYRTQTLASGGEYCNFYICKQGSRWDKEKQNESENKKQEIENHGENNSKN